MMQQAPLNFERQEGMHRATAHAGPQWAEVAYSFLCKFAREHEFVFGESVTKAAREWGLVDAPTDRAWGSLYPKAIRAGVLALTPHTQKRNNGSLARVYKSMVYAPRS